MSEIRRGFVPFGEFKPDLRYLANDGLLEAKNVVPVYGSYISGPFTSTIQSLGLAANESANGLMCSTYNKNGYVSVVNPVAVYSDLLEVTEGGTVTNRTRTAATNYALSYLTGGCSFGSSVVACLGSATAAPPEPVQYLASGASRFANMITSTFEPRGQFAFPLRNNLFLANCYLPGAYDGLSSGANPTLVAWSRNDDIRQFGSFNADPQIIGAGYQSLNFDLGAITGGVVSDDFGIIALENGLVRVDGPLYTFRVIGRNHGLAAANVNGICIAGNDVYWIGPAGLMRLRGGDGLPERIGGGRFSRWLIDDSGFSTAPFNTTPVQLRHDPINNLLFFRYVSNSVGNAVILIYNIDEDRASYLVYETTSTTPDHIDSCPFGTTGNWSPGRDLRMIHNGGRSYGKFVLGNFGTDAVLQKGYIQLSPEVPTRFTRIRPIYSALAVEAVEQVVVYIKSTNKPYATPTTHGPFSSVDSMGWITTPTTAFADFHSVQIFMTSNTNIAKIVEYEGFEYEAIESTMVYAA